LPFSPSGGGKNHGTVAFLRLMLTRSGLASGAAKADNATTRSRARAITVATFNCLLCMVVTSE
jgi:hypothetical protein